MAVDREALRVRLIDILATFGPRRSWDGPGGQRRVDYWLDRLMEADRPDDGSPPSTWQEETERLRRRVAELEVAYDLRLEDLEDLEAERDGLWRRLAVLRALHGPAVSGGALVCGRDGEAWPCRTAVILDDDTPSLPVVDSE